MTNKSLTHKASESFGFEQAVHTPHIESFPLAFGHKIKLHGEILSSEKYFAEFDLIDSATEDDLVTVDVNSIGGNYNTAMVFNTKLLECEAQTVAEIDGYCASAATMIALSCDELVVKGNVSFHIHQPSGGFLGAFNEASAQSDHYREMTLSFYNKVYSGFLSDDEIVDVLKGHVIILNAKQVEERFENLKTCRIEQAMGSKVCDVEDSEGGIHEVREIDGDQVIFTNDGNALLVTGVSAVDESGIILGYQSNEVLFTQVVTEDNESPEDIE